LKGAYGIKIQVDRNDPLLDPVSRNKSPICKVYIRRGLVAS